MRRMDIVLGAAAALVAAAPSGARDLPATSPLAIAAELRVSPSAPELLSHPGLLGRLRGSPYDYFRFVNQPFSRAVCELFGDVRGSLPDVTLHGDAHVEQYAVTSLGRGLVDFDDSARGPYVIDLVRFGVSLELAAREHGWPGSRAVDDFVRGYRDALADPRLDLPPGTTLRRARAQFGFDHGLLLRRAEALILADPVASSELASDFATYVEALRRQAPELPARYFRLKEAGRLKLGIASALDEKYLLRIEGWTASPNDDQIVEAKLVHPLSREACVHSDAGPGRVSLGMLLVARAPFPLSGVFVHGGRPFWVHGWTDDYVELDVESSFPDARDLQQVAYDVGTQLGRAHARRDSGRSAARLRTALLASTNRNEARIRCAIDELAEASLEAWRSFRDGR
jgi:hypothetical protein